MWSPSAVFAPGWRLFGYRSRAQQELARRRRTCQAASDRKRHQLNTQRRRGAGRGAAAAIHPCGDSR